MRRILLCGLKTVLVIIWQIMWLLFVQWPKSLPEAKVKRFWSVILGEKISEQPNIDSIARLLIFNLTKTCNEKNECFYIRRQVLLSISLAFDEMPHMLPVTYLFLRATLGAVYFIVCLSHSGMADYVLSSALVAARSRPSCRFCNWQASLDSSVLMRISVILNAWVTF